MAKNRQAEKQTEENFGSIEGALTKSEKFFEDNQKTIVIILIAIVIVVLAVFGTQKLFIQPKENTAQTEIYKAQKYFDDGEYEKALNGDSSSYLGFLQIAEQYKFTKTAKIAHYYIGISYLRIGQYENAITNLKKFKSKDYYIYAMSRAAIGDAYVELNDLESAVKFYKEACSIRPNDLTTPEFMEKLAITYELKGNNADALATYKDIIAKYPTTIIKNDINRSIGRLEMTSSNTK